MYKVPLTNSPNQTFSTSIPVNGENKYFVITLKYNYQANYWVMDISDEQTEKYLVAGIPLLCSTYDFANLLRQFGYKFIGNAYIAPISNKKLSMPNNENLGTDFVLAWSDNDV